MGRIPQAGKNAREVALSRIIGNVAEKVVRHAPCPVLMIKPRAAPDDAAARPRDNS